MIRLPSPLTHLDDAVDAASEARMDQAFRDAMANQAFRDAMKNDALKAASRSQS